MNGIAITMTNGFVGTTGYALREIQAGEVLIKIDYSAISPGTELRCLNGKQEGMATSVSYVPGYSSMGRVVQSRHTSIHEGARVFAGGSKDAGELKILWGGHLSHAICNGDEVSVVPDSVDSKIASLTKLGAIPLHGLKKGKVRKGEKVAILGLGVIGAISAVLHKHAGADIVCCDLSEVRVNTAVKMGLKSLLLKGSLKETFTQHLPEGASLVVDSTGVPSVLSQGIELAAETAWNNSEEPEIRYLIQGSYANAISIPYQEAFLKQLSYIIPRDCQKQDRDDFLSLCSSHAFDLSPIISGIVLPEKAAEAYLRLKDPKSVPGTIIFDWNQI
ncbi:MAG: hypothetical protein A2268_08295 [Candidatus Raymondbacteria bacterium RifOxyA12_full_50_37]|uniref:Uncharacterized protein n=1 Tax=Candidatus Raymondbacteria bacterium RIFOXYD12_FULL_49_13 TaxID=1817890 RepID=A0A1F7F3T0_UNCRA|nr:MAG: hypothetical protein A2268_08295 [Candidatus Raymondbacteria bacterium RifOxyA12_full_50_37]OGJ90333.1 MAG: hypothetical protein A2248_17230 [Candidatus Raymondbacteria bacterium RIFOXYA2_FULL_49_16]OGJ99509.1 MAG: hypothetical protein A2350_00700 [Candidatus Raymondbacteria bacterium RifOxyB12_full_50_8]OGK01330.1 MAG: hypothetical protein A2519_13090 [Candidatus Raymondbacteria bacterium RIFOXYD12_FULL_49_13]OGK07514.1 MAG: hypothetical protein A2487_11365 [Candidatus Raymondbacteria 